MLAPTRWRRVASWICGWLYLIGNITITLAVNFGTTLFFVACVNVFESEPGVGIFPAETWQVFLIFLAITLLCNAVSAFGNKWLPWLDVSNSQILVHSSLCACMRVCACTCSLTQDAFRLLPSSGPLRASSPSLSPSWSLLLRAVAVPNMPSHTSSRVQDGLMAGRSWSVCCTPVMPPRQQA